MSTPSGSWEFSLTLGYRWETTSQKFLTPAPLPHNYALRVLRSHGLQPNELHLVARATTVASIFYASPAWYGFAKEGDRKHLDRLIDRMRRCGYLPRDFPCLAALVDEADRQLNSSGPYLTTLRASYVIISSTNLNLVTPFVHEHITSSFIRTLSCVPLM